MKYILGIFVGIFLFTLIYPPQVLASTIEFDAVTYHSTSVPTVLHRFSHTITGVNPFITVSVVSSLGDPGSTTLKYNGQHMTQLGSTQYVSDSQTYVSTYYLAAPTPGTHDVEVALQNPLNTYVIAASYKGVDQFSPIDVNYSQTIDDSFTRATQSQSITTTRPKEWTLKFTRSSVGRSHHANIGVHRIGNGIGVTGTEGSGSLIDSGVSVLPQHESTLEVITSDGQAFDRFVGTMFAIKPATHRLWCIHAPLKSCLTQE